MQSYIRHKQPVEIKLITGEVLVGLLNWIDANCLNLKSEGQSFLIWFPALAYIKPVGSPQA
jgi:host factor-I protein